MRSDFYYYYFYQYASDLIEFYLEKFPIELFIT